MGSKPPTANDLAAVRAYDRFLDEQNGVYPATFVAIILLCTLQNVDYLAKVGHIKWTKVGGKRLYGVKSVKDCRWWDSREYHDNGSGINVGPGIGQKRVPGLHCPTRTSWLATDGLPCPCGL